MAEPSPAAWSPPLCVSYKGSPEASLALSALQGRQKLARFNAREFATLIIDILSEAKRRQQGKSLSSPTGGRVVGGGAGSGRGSRGLSYMALSASGGLRDGLCGGVRPE